MAGGNIVCLAIATAIRYLLVFMNSDILHNRVEISTPLNSFKRIKEGVHLFENGIDPYTGDMVHEGPLILLGHAWLFNNCPKIVPYVYILVDVLTAVILSKMARYWVEDKWACERKEASTFAKGTKDLQIQVIDFDTIPKYVLLSYLFNPFLIANCASLTTTVFSNFFTALYFLFLAKRQQFPCLLFLALESVRNLYPFILISPAILIFSKGSIHRAFAVVLQFFVLCGALALASAKLSGSWSFLDGTLGFIFFYRDLQPNIGLFWYFFTEMFEHFRPMFLVTFQMNATVLYLIPLTLKLRKDPLMLATVLVSMITIFKSYPSFGDFGFYLSLIPIWKRWKFMTHNFVVFCFFLITVLIMPPLWHLWIYAGSANANFYFGATLAFSTGQIFLVTDLLFAYVKREFCLRHGQKLFIDGKEAKIILE